MQIDSPSQPMAPDSRFAESEAPAAASAAMPPAAKADAKAEPEKQTSVAQEAAKEEDEEFPLLALWPVFVMISIVAILIVATFTYGKEKVIQFILQHLMPSRPNAWHVCGIFSAIVLCTVLFIPVLMVLLLVPGMMLGFFKGYMLVFIAETVAAITSFLIGRYVAQRPLRQYLKTRGCERTMRVLHILEDEQQQSMQLLILYRFIMMPMALRNYGPAILQVPLPKLVLSIIPHCLWSALVFASAGSTLWESAQLLRDGHEINWRTPKWQEVLGLVFAIGSTIGFAFIAFRAYLRVEKEEASQEAFLLPSKGSEGGDYGAAIGCTTIEVHTSGS